MRWLGRKFMKIRDLAKDWEVYASVKQAARDFNVKLPLYDAARIMALAEMYPERTENQIITELISAALDEFAEGLPYIKGEKIIAEDEYYDPTYEDAGPTPIFINKTQYFISKLESDLKNTKS
jgi:hypothetical protein